MQKVNPPATYPGIGSKRNPREPLYGFVPRRVTAEQVRDVLVRERPQDAAGKLTRPQDGDINPFNKQPHSAQYKKILQVRRKLPVYAQMDEFYEMVSVLP